MEWPIYTNGSRRLVFDLLCNSPVQAAVNRVIYILNNLFGSMRLVKKHFRLN
jgi:hypothetical protein